MRLMHYACITKYLLVYQFSILDNPLPPSLKGVRYQQRTLVFILHTIVHITTYTSEEDTTTFPYEKDVLSSQSVIDIITTTTQASYNNKYRAGFHVN